MRPNLYREVATQIGSLIVQGKVHPGSVLPNEAALGAQFGVSRTALREAVKVLAAKGLIEVRRKTGTRVNQRLSWNMLDPEILAWMFAGDGMPQALSDLMEVRMLVEPAAARMAADRADSEDLREIREAMKGMEVATGNLPSSVDSDLRFHMAVLKATHNAFMRPFGALIQAALRGSFHLTSSNENLYKLTLPLHRKVLAAIETGDSAKAESAMRTLLTQTMRDIEAQRKAMRIPRFRSTGSRRSH